MKALIAAGLTLLLAASATSVQAGNGGKGKAQGAFNSVGTGLAVVDFGAASHANPAAAEKKMSVLIFGYAQGPSAGRTYCGDVWNVIVTVNVDLFGDATKAEMAEISATQTLDGVLVGATDSTPVRWSSTIGALTQAHGTFLAPGTLYEGTHVVSQTLEHPLFGTVWAPDPLVFEVDDSAC